MIYLFAHPFYFHHLITLFNYDVGWDSMDSRMIITENIGLINISIIFYSRYSNRSTPSLSTLAQLRSCYYWPSSDVCAHLCSCYGWARAMAYRWSFWWMLLCYLGVLTSKSSHQESIMWSRSLFYTSMRCSLYLHFHTDCQLFASIHIHEQTNRGPSSRP